jgi:hypothetical protein
VQGRGIGPVVAAGDTGRFADHQVVLVVVEYLRSGQLPDSVVGPRGRGFEGMVDLEEVSGDQAGLGIPDPSTVHPNPPLPQQTAHQGRGQAAVELLQESVESASVVDRADFDFSGQCFSS